MKTLISYILLYICLILFMHINVFSQCEKMDTVYMSNYKMYKYPICKTYSNTCFGKGSHPLGFPSAGGYIRNIIFLDNNKIAALDTYFSNIALIDIETGKIEKKTKAKSLDDFGDLDCLFYYKDHFFVISQGDDILYRYDKGLLLASEEKFPYRGAGYKIVNVDSVFYIIMRGYEKALPNQERKVSVLKLNDDFSLSKDTIIINRNKLNNFWSNNIQYDIKRIENWIYIFSNCVIFKTPELINKKNLDIDYIIIAINSSQIALIYPEDGNYTLLISDYELPIITED